MLCRLERRFYPEKFSTLELHPLSQEDISIKALVLNESNNGYCIVVHKNEIQNNNQWIIQNQGRYEFRWRIEIEDQFLKVGLFNYKPVEVTSDSANN